MPRDLRDQAPFSGGEHLFEGIEDANLLALARERGANKLTELTYKHFQKEMNLINKAFYEVLTEGDSTGQPFTFPIPTVNITEDFDWEGKTCLSCLKTPPKSVPLTSRTSSAASTPSMNTGNACLTNGPTSRMPCVPCAAASSWTCGNCSNAAAVSSAPRK